MDQASEKGFVTKSNVINVAKKIALIHTEIPEAFEAYRQKILLAKTVSKRN